MVCKLLMPARAKKVYKWGEKLNRPKTKIDTITPNEGKCIENSKS